MGLTFFNQRRAREAEKAKLLEAQKVEPVKVEEVAEPVETVEVIEETPIIEPCETEIFEATKPKKKTDAEKLKRKK